MSILAKNNQMSTIVMAVIKQMRRDICQGFEVET